MAAQGRDDILFELAYALEQAAPWPVQLTV
jgi:hypothetical protein